ncbi:MAG: LysR family transcriptional regulator, partial [Pseudomonadota bacterium]|nr:LysR family transcriptional regulator [Pseudomonadota bacterium]
MLLLSPRTVVFHDYSNIVTALQNPCSRTDVRWRFYDLIALSFAVFGAMNIDHLLTFLEVVATGSFHRAAANLNVTQSTVSARIRA